MVLLKRREIKQRPLRIIRTGGYVVLFGILIGVTLGVYALFNPPLFPALINISQYEATIFFLGVSLPSFVIIVALGYVFVTTPKLEGLNLWRTATLCTLILLCLTLSALSILNFLSFLGGFFALIAVALAYTKPTFKALWKREACFLVETGTILIASSSMLFLLMWFISRFLQTYSPGIYEANYSYPHTLLVIVVLSLLTFFMTPFLCLQGANKGPCGILSLTISILSFVTIIQNQYVYFNLSAYQGIFLAGIGIILTFCGALIYLKLFISEAILSPALAPSFLYWGKYCPYCGEPWINFDKDFCSSCGRSLSWKLKTSFCPYCGRLVPGNTGNCPHCMEDIGSLPVYISLIKRKEERLLMKKGKPGRLRKALGFLSEHAAVLKRAEPFLREFVYICILTFLFAFLSFIGYRRTEPAGIDELLVSHYGFPIEWLKVFFVVSPIAVVTRARIMWAALILDFILYSVSAFVIVYGTKRLRS